MELRCSKTVVETAEELRHVLLKDGAGRLQLAVSGADFYPPVQLFSEALWSSERASYRLRALERLNAIRAGAGFPARLFPADARGHRLRFVLRALDGSLAGASHREIAEVLIGQGRVDADWSDPGEHLRDRIRRAVRRGHILLNGGYKVFLS